jgi:hypothetical protein
MMYRVIRNTHLVLGLSSALFVLLHAVSAAQIAHRWPLSRQIADEDLTLPAGLAARPLSAALMDRRGISGELGNPQTTPSGMRIMITRPGVQYIVNYVPATGQTHVRREVRGFMAMLNRLHHQNGLHHSDRTLNLWFRIHRERTAAVVLLTANIAISVGLLVALRY